jgi:hypothetical protein
VKRERAQASHGAHVCAGALPVIRLYSSPDPHMSRLEGWAPGGLGFDPSGIELRSLGPFLLLYTDSCAYIIYSYMELTGVAVMS